MSDLGAYVAVAGCLLLSVILSAGTADVAGARTSKPSAPGAPTGVTVVAANTALFASWTAPSSGTASITGYRATAKAKGLPAESCTTTGSTSCVITGIVNSVRHAKKKYSVSVKATSSDGTGKAGTAPGTYQGTTAQNCSYVGAFGNLQGCALTDANLSGVNLTSANLTDAVLAGANLAGTNLTNADLVGVQSGGITGTPAALPANWQVVGSYLVGPGANLAGADEDGTNFSNVDLAGASLVNAQFVSANLTDANLSSSNLTGASLEYATATGADVAAAIWSNTACPDGTNSNGDGGTCADDLACPTHSNGIGQTYLYCGPLGTDNGPMAIDAAEAYAVSIGTPLSDVSDGWECDTVPSLEAAGISDGSGDAVGYLWVYDGVEKDWVVPVSDCAEEVGSWN